MCAAAMIFRTGHRPLVCDTRGELARALSMHESNLPEPAGLPFRQGWNTCLCNTDIKALGQMIGAMVEPPSYALDTDHHDAWAIRLH